MGMFQMEGREAQESNLQISVVHMGAIRMESSTERKQIIQSSSRTSRAARSCTSRSRRRSAFTTSCSLAHFRPPLFPSAASVISEASLPSAWVMTELRKARQAGRQSGQRKLFPVRLAVASGTLRKVPGPLRRRAVGQAGSTALRRLTPAIPARCSHRARTRRERQSVRDPGRPFPPRPASAPRAG